MLWEVALLIIACAFVVLVVALLPVLRELRSAVAETQRLAAAMNEELAPLMREMRSVTADMSRLLNQVESSVEHATLLFRAIGDVGDRLQSAQNRIDEAWGRTERAFGRKANMMFLGLGASLRAIASMVRRRMRGHESERSVGNGQ